MEPKQYVNGAMLSRNIGKSVNVIGKVTANGPSGNDIKLQLSDGKEVTARLDEQHQEPVKGYVQMVAMVNNDLSLNSEAFICFGTGEIDMTIYNQVVDTMKQYSNLFSASQVNGSAM